MADLVAGILVPAVELRQRRIDCRFEELTVDSPRNRNVRAALESVARLVWIHPIGHHHPIVTGGEAEVTPSLQSRQGFVAVLAVGVLEGIAAAREALGAMQGQFGLELISSTHYQCSDRLVVVRHKSILCQMS